MKSIRSKVLFVSLMLIAPNAQAINRVGDANNSGSLENADAAQVQSFLYGLIAPSQISPLALADADSDLDLADCMRVAQAANGAALLSGPGSLLAISHAADPTLVDGGPIYPVAFDVVSAYPTATRVDGLEIAINMSPGESTLGGVSNVVAGGQANASFTPANAAAPNDVYLIVAEITVRDSADVATADSALDTMIVTVAPALCGDGIINGAEICDDGFVSDCGLCNIDCTGPGSGFVCGDGLQCDGEVCDDGNTIDCDGCKGDCSEVETDCPGAVCDGTAASPACWLDSQCAPPTCFDGPGDCYEAVCAGYAPGAEIITWSNEALVGTLNGWTDDSTVGSSLANASGGAPTSDYSPRNGGTYVIPFTTQTIRDEFRVCVAASRIDVGGGPVRNVTLQTSVDGSPLFNRTFNVDDSWSWSCSGSFSLDAGPHTLEFDCLNASGKSRCAIDGVVVTTTNLNPFSDPGFTPYAIADWDDPALDLKDPDVLGRCDAFDLAPITCGDGLACGWEECDDGAANHTCGPFNAGDCMSSCSHRAECDGGDQPGSHMVGFGCSTDGRIEPPGCVNMSDFGYCVTDINGGNGCPNGGICFMGSLLPCITDWNVGCCYGGSGGGGDDCSPGNPCDIWTQECEMPDCFNSAWGTCFDAGYEPDGTPCGDSTVTECNLGDVCLSGQCDENYEPLGTPCGDQGVECLVDDHCEIDGSCLDNGYQPAGWPCSTCGSPPCACDGAGNCVP